MNLPLETIAERRARLDRDAIARNAPAMRREFWVGKAEGYQPERRAGPIIIL